MSLKHIPFQALFGLVPEPLVFGRNRHISLEQTQMLCTPQMLIYKPISSAKGSWNRSPTAETVARVSVSDFAACDLSVRHASHQS